MIGEVGIPFEIALMGVMLQMINAKAHRAGHEVGKVGDDGHHFVPAFIPENQVMGRIVNNHVIGMVGERADAISDEKAEPPVAKSQCPHPVGYRRLHERERHSDERSVWIAHHQSANFRMRFNDRACPRRMRLLKLGLMEEGLHGRPCFLAQNSRKDHLLPKLKFFAKIGRFAQSAPHWPS